RRVPRQPCRRPRAGRLRRRGLQLHDRQHGDQRPALVLGSLTRRLRGPSAEGPVSSGAAAVLALVPLAPFAALAADVLVEAAQEVRVLVGGERPLAPRRTAAEVALLAHEQP